MRRLVILVFWAAFFCSQAPAQVLSLPFDQDFESFNICPTGCGSSCALVNGWVNASGDNGDWLVDVNGTTSSNTGPSQDHNPGTSTGHYLYIEASSPCSPSRTFNLLTPTIDLSTANAGQMSFWYHMFGGTMGTLHIDASTSGGANWTNDIAPARTDNQDLWQPWQVDLSAFTGDTVTIRLRGVTGSGYESDMAVDDFHFFDLLPDDAGVTTFVRPGFPACNLTDSVFVKLRNFGTDTLFTCSTVLEQNGILLSARAWAGALPPGAQSAPVFCGLASLSPGDTLCAWTTVPNGVPEPLSGAANDTTCKIILTGMAGQYTLGGSGADFYSFAQVLNALESRGVCGPVEILLADSVWQEQPELRTFAGMSPVNTVTFRSASGNRNNCRLEWSSTQLNRNFTLRLDNADFFRFESITLAATGLSLGRVVEIKGGSERNIFRNCRILGPVGIASTSTDFALIFSDGDSDPGNLFAGNLIENGSYGVWWYGVGANLPESGNRFLNNHFLNQYYYGIRLYYQDSPEIGRNIWESNTTYGGSVWRIHCFECENDLRIFGNQLRGDQYGYGIYLGNCDAPATNHGRVWNNFVEVGNPGSSNSSYGIYVTNSGYIDIVGNNVNVVSGAAGSRACYFTSGGANVLFNNNLVVQGPGYGLYLATLYSLLASDYNNIYAPGGNAGFWNTDQATLSDFQTISGLDSNSLSLDPHYFSNRDLHICNDSLDGAGKSIPWLGFDIDRHPRGRTPDIGADEFVPMSDFSLGPDTSLCAGDSLLLFAGAPGDTVSWNTGGTGTRLWVSGPGTYSVSVNGNCGTGQDSIEVSYASRVYSGFLQADTNIFCVGDTATLSSSRFSDQYLWSTGDTTSTLQVFTSGTYSLTLSDGCGNGSDSLEINFGNPPLASFSHTVSFYTAVFVDSGMGATSWFWDFGDASGTSTLQNPLYVYNNPGTYLVTLTVSNSCGSHSFSDSITIDPLNGRPEPLNEMGLEVWPNPNQGKFSLSLNLSEAKVLQYSVVDLWGRELLSTVPEMGRGQVLEEVVLPVSGPGMYLLKIRVGDELIVYPIVVE